ncbi:MAG: helicase [Sulfobacillus thermosulfidooxidans]|uniref:Helicase n=1 Tax=Sulfobacillus thermosulfidooxidans TaxID=28034 RepID=A0A2T2WTZ7_SULTH|nr:MAG: helicase [Sulfobacillus thermosulfidooxidans]
MINDFVEARTKLLEQLRRNLVGPSREDEQLTEHPVEHYLMGYLSSVNGNDGQDQDNDEPTLSLMAPDDGETVDDDIPDWIHGQKNRTMGFTCHVIHHAVLTVRLYWGRYYKDGHGQSAIWQREPHEILWELNLDDASSGIKTLDSTEGMEVRVHLRPSGSGWMITFAVLNVGSPILQDDRHYDERAFQVRLEVEGHYESSVFEAKDFRPHTDDHEYWREEIRYRKVQTYAIGHGCAVQWHGNPVTCITTEWIPSHEVSRAATSVLADDPALSLSFLSDMTRRDTVIAGLRRLNQTYRKWIDALESEIPSIIHNEFPPSVYSEVKEASQAILNDNQRAYQRIEDGINRLQMDDLAWEAFCLANQAMARSMTRRHANKESQWRAFQLAFLLLAFPSAIDHDHVDRQVFDLIWFPTGGGKTEAYLGLSALVIFYRRLRGENGLAVLTRYTLRLLTVQQFERTARMICAAELVRQSHPHLHQTKPIRVGLFVGRQLTPNDLDNARALLKEHTPEGTTTTLPLLHCPWCERPLDITHQRVQGVLRTACPNPECPFADELPIRIVDEDLYQEPPDMVVATLDKLARLPWEPRMSSLFQQGPDLIIQDELHLIGEALGSLAALYETAIDSLAAIHRTAPKIIGSTATSRRADRQVAILFKRQFQQFPPGGLNAEDAFFYQEDRSNPGRLYVGVLAAGRSMPHALERVSGVLLQEVTNIKDPCVRDQYWTLAIYFKALRELGGALVLLQDSVPRYMDTLVPSGTQARPIQVEELTSQIPSRKIPEILSRLSQPILELQSSEQLTNGEPVDVVLATNMISVGIDVDRLGIMVLDGQPYSTSEYIQATSRVGRRLEAAGLVVTIYNWARPRDRSIYEHFYPYHAAMYRHVESVSATPFSLRARERALHAVFFTMARHAIAEFQPRDSAGRIREPALQEALKPWMERIIERVKMIDPEEVEATRKHLQNIFEQWLDLAEEFPGLAWNSLPFRKDPALMIPAESEKEAMLGWITLQSMRDVSPPAAVHILSSNELHKKRGR